MAAQTPIAQLAEALAQIIAARYMFKLPRIMLQSLVKPQALPLGHEAEAKLIDTYGNWQVQRAKSVCPRGDWACIEKEASRLAAVHKSRYGQKVNRGYTLIRDLDEAEIWLLERNIPGSSQVLEKIRIYGKIGFNQLLTSLIDADPESLRRVIYSLKSERVISEVA